MDKELENKPEQKEDIKLQIENREIYPSLFRNIDTNIAFRVYDDNGNLVQTNRGVLSGSWISYIGVSGSGKTTLALQMASNMMRPFIQVNNFDPRVKLYFIDVENGVHDGRFKQLTGWTDLQMSRHLVRVDDTTIEGLWDLVNKIIREKEDKAYKTNKRVGSRGVMTEIYPPTFIFIDSISELMPRDFVEDEANPANTIFMKQNNLLDQFTKANKVKFSKYNITILAINHTSKNMNLDNPMARPVRAWKALPADIKINGAKAAQYATDLGFYIEKIEATDRAKVEAKGGRILDASSIMQARIFKNRQGLENVVFYLVFDTKGKFDPLGSFVYECQQIKVIESAGATKKINGTDKTCHASKLIENIITDAEFRQALYDRYDKEKEDTLESNRINEEERNRLNDILDIMSI